MIPHCFTRDADDLWVVAEVADITGLRRWVDYIPVQVVSELPAQANRYENDGYIPISMVDPDGLVAWTDYTPVHTVEGNPIGNAWTTLFSNGFIPVFVEQEEEIPNTITIDSTPAPTFTGLSPDTYAMADHVTYTGGGTLVYTLLPDDPHSAGITFDSGTGVLTYDGENSPTSYQRTLHVTDGTDEAESDPFNIVIEEVVLEEITFPDAAFYVGVSDTTATNSTNEGAHTVTAGTSLLLVAVGLKANEEVTGITWNGEALALVADLDPGGSSTTFAVEVWGLIDPTPDTGDIVVTTVATINDCHWVAGLNVAGTVTTALEDAIQLLSTDDNNGAATTTAVHGSAGSIDNKVLFIGAARGDDMIPTSNNSGFTELVEDNTGGGSGAGLDMSCYIAESDAPDGLTVTWNASDLNISGLFQLVAGGGGGGEPPSQASFGVVQGDPGYAWPTIVPGGRGVGMDSFGGSGRHLETPATTVYYVNSLATGSSGSGNAGTLRWCLQQTGPRMIIPAISGMIDYGLGGTFQITDPYFTYAGQCAPGDGLAVYNLALKVLSHNGLLWHWGGFMGDAESQADGNNISVGGGANNVHHVIVANSDLFFSHDQSWQIFLANAPGVTTNNTFWQCNTSMGQIGPGFNIPSDEPDTELGPWGFGCLVSLYNQKNASKASVLRNMFLKNFRRSPSVSEGYCEYSNNLTYDNDFAVEVKVHNNAGGGANTRHNVRNNVIIKGPNGIQSANSCIMLTANSIGNPGGYFCITGNRKHSDFTTAQLVFNTSTDPVVSTPHASAIAPGFVLRDIPDTDEGIEEFAIVMAAHCGMRPAHRIPYVQESVDGMLAYLAGGTDTVARIRDTSYPMAADPPGWPITLSTQGETIDHETTGSHGVGVIPTVGKDVVQASGYTLLEEWTHLHADWAMGGTGWRL